jgi:melanoma-associated antigen
LERYLKRANADTSTPVDKTDKLLNRMIKDGYIVRIKDSLNGDETVEYRVGPRGKVEVGAEGVAGLVRKVYGEDGTEELEKRLENTLGLGDGARRAPGTQNPAAGPRRARGRARRSTQADKDEDEENGGSSAHSESETDA